MTNHWLCNSHGQGVTSAAILFVESLSFKRTRTRNHPQHFWFKTLWELVSNVCSKCSICQKCKVSHKKYGHLPIKEAEAEAKPDDFTFLCVIAIGIM
jgi:hypothetical protein